MMEWGGMGLLEMTAYGLAQCWAPAPCRRERVYMPVKALTLSQPLPNWQNQPSEPNQLKAAANSAAAMTTVIF